MWTMLNDKWATATEKQYINTTMFGQVPGYPMNYFTFKAVSGLVRNCVCGIDELGPLRFHRHSCP